jgi:hypothetical protein
MRWKYVSTDLNTNVALVRLIDSKFDISEWLNWKGDT